MKPWQHFKTITRHRLLVMVNCFRIGLIRQGLTHDLSKYSPTEFWTGAKYYQGIRSPNAAEREKKGYSAAWLHHKGREPASLRVLDRSESCHPSIRAGSNAQTVSGGDGDGSHCRQQSLPGKAVHGWLPLGVLFDVPGRSLDAPADRTPIDHAPHYAPGSGGNGHIPFYPGDGAPGKGLLRSGYDWSLQPTWYRAQSGAYQNAHGNLRGLLILLQKQLQSYAENIQTKKAAGSLGSGSKLGCWKKQNGYMLNA